ncbi:LLM class F420-dependent oxidoreductase [Mycolicibacterium insubricum]|jgi:F420-dependent oxidoreductase-like protein|uniref:LLM class F420-dependent oxidoreductase n=1 Tax=Mycolicibacterium insubricum TaxID=444597 RepID=A0A1X0DN46_9MYCO|nr:LLM class F420-dependent oxidoreductase [Mycolicibacterium insubricum]MCB9441772.1 LLM class F420-dependent oxidoreductase [Mycolicibacterium sp.]ORA73798.1 LLM class F420-dependent oxidoreductase [Mycolicibacterium insubricum]BBZ67380.1 LLM class F420-dependent oxidoreductase [Mycolicibacterium insubricum]
MTFRLGLLIPKFASDPKKLFPTLVAQTREAEAAGYEAVFVMDHFYQAANIGAVEDPMPEAYTTLGALAAATDTVQLGALVTGVTYRNPALVAKEITTLDVISAGRAILGMGAGWYELEHRQLGFDFGTFGERFNRLDEALQIIGPMVDGQRPTFTGSYYRTEEALAQPRYRDHIPLMLGGSGEKKAIPMAARYFDHMNLMCDLSELPRKAEVVRRCCEDIGRDPATLATSTMVVVDVDGTMSPEQIAAASANFISGSPTAIAEQIKARVFDAGVGGVVLSVFDYRPGVVAELADALRPLLPA